MSEDKNNKRERIPVEVNVNDVFRIFNERLELRRIPHNFVHLSSKEDFFILVTAVFFWSDTLSYPNKKCTEEFLAGLWKILEYLILGSLSRFSQNVVCKIMYGDGFLIALSLAK